MAELAQQHRRVAGIPEGGIGGAAVHLDVAGARTLLNLRGDATDTRFCEIVAEVAGAPLPERPNGWTGGEDGSVAWLGPDEWLIMAPEGRASSLEGGLRERCGDDAASAMALSVVDVSHNDIGFVLSGIMAREVLAKGCPLDLHAGAFAKGRCAQTRLAQTRALLICRAEHTIEIRVRNSFAAYIARWLQDAMKEFSDSE